MFEPTKPAVATSTIIFYALVVCLTILITVCLIFLFKTDDVSNFTSPLDNKQYAVRNTENKDQAANYLAILSNKIDILVNYMKKNNLPNQIIADRLYYRWSNCKLKETSSSDKSVAFTLNKDAEVRLCIRYNGQFEDINTSMFVLLHELAHVMSVTYGHNEEFLENFSFLVQLASKLNLYIPEDFTKNPKTYCGSFINTTPCSEDRCGV